MKASPDLMHDEQFPIIADSDRPVTPLRVLKHGDCFGVFDPRGDIVPGAAGEEGLYCDGTRFLSRFELLIFDHRPLLLSSTQSGDDALFEADLTNPDVMRDGHGRILRGEINLRRSRVLLTSRCVERIRVTYYGRGRLVIPLTIRLDADFADVFEVRGTHRAARGLRMKDAPGDDYVMCYRGLDHVERRARVTWNRRPDAIERGLLRFSLPLEPDTPTIIDISVSYETNTASLNGTPNFDDALERARARDGTCQALSCHLTTSSGTFNRWFDRSGADLQVMMTDTPFGPYPYAGIPWFSTPFGRDGIVTAFELLWLDASVARGVLEFLARTQATEFDDARDEQPGKILHEMRNGEMAALDEVPFRRYYGSCDATPLFVMLAYAYYVRTGDLDLIDRIWPQIMAALDWMSTSGDPDGDGFIEYARQSETGLVQQGWKDSWDSVSHMDGSLAAAPIALCEVQGYAYAAWLGAARLARLKGERRLARDWNSRADHLRTHFDEAFWCEEIGTYALALDGDKQQCRVRTSNPGHCLFAGIVPVSRADRVCRSLMDETSFAGWGVRTMAEGEARFNPQSYHNGSIWPHDNAIIAAGLARYGFTGAAGRLLNANFELSEAVDLHRLPELICGFPRRGREPTLYPVACSPQSWAAGAAFMLLGAALGVQIDAPARRISFTRGRLPESLNWIRMVDLAIGDARIDLLLERHPHDVGVTVLRRVGDVEIISIK